MSRQLDRERREWRWLPAALFVAALMFLWSFRLYNLWDMTEGWVISDEGHQLYQSLRWEAGQWYFRDFSTDNYPPGTIWLHAALYRVFGIRMSVIRTLLVLVGAGISVLAYSLARRVMPAGWAILAYLLCLTWNVPSLNMGYPSWYCVLLALGAAWCLLRYVHRQSVGWLIAAGILIGLSIGMKTTQGVFQGIGLALFLAWRSVAGAPERNGRRRLLSWEGAMAVATLLPALALLRSYPTLVNLMVFLMPLCLLAGAILAGRPAWEESVERRRSFLQELLWLAAGAAAVTAAWVVPTVVAVGWSLFVEGAFLAPLRHSAFMYARIQWPTLNGWLTLAWAVGGLAWLGRSGRARPAAIAAYGLLGIGLFCFPFADGLNVREALRAAFRNWQTLRFFLSALVSVSVWILLWRRRVADANRPALVLIVALGSWNFLQLYPFSDSNHLMWSIQPAFIGLAYLGYRAWVSLQAKLDRSAAPGQVHTLRSGLALAGVGALPALLIVLQLYPLFGHFFSLEGGFQRVSYEMLDSDRADVYVRSETARELRAVGEAIEGRARPTDTILDTSGSFFYFFTGRHNATRQDFWWPGFMTEEEVDQVISDLSRRQPAVVVRRETAEHVLGYASFAETYPSVAEYIEAHYQPDIQIGSYGLWTRK